MAEYSLLIASSERSTTNSNSSTDFTLTFPSGSIPFATSAQLKWISIPLSTYVVNTSNQNISYTESTFTVTAVIPVGDYDASSLASALQTAMNNVKPATNVYSVSYNTQTYNFTISAASTFTIHWSTNTSLGTKFGFIADSTGSTQTSTQAAQLNPLSINVQIYELSSLCYTGSVPLVSTFVVPITSSTGYNLFYSPEIPLITKFAAKTFTTLHIKLTDLNGSVIDLNGSDWTMLITLYSSNPI